MNSATDGFAGLEVGYDIPARPGMDLDAVQTPCLVLDLDALERNLRRMGDLARAAGLRLRPHAKMHKSVDVARLQMAIGGAEGICCQKVSEAEVFARAGLKDILVSNQVRGAVKVDRLARLPLLGGRIAVCVDDPAGVDELSGAVRRHGTSLDVLVEIDCGAGRCGVASPEAAVRLARDIAAAPGLRFAGVQAYQGALQHVADAVTRQAQAAAAIALTRKVVAALQAAGLPPGTVTGGGTGSHPFELAAGVHDELQCGSYAFMDADYGRIVDLHGQRLDAGTAAGAWDNALFILTSVMSRAYPGRAVCDAGLKVMSLDSGLPTVFGRPDLTYDQCSDEHGTISDPAGSLQVGDRLRLVPGHCDPTCNLHDWYVGLRGDRVDCLWPVSARGKAF